MDDLLVAGPGGITESQCQSIKDSLGKIVNVATQIPDKPIWPLTAIWEVMVKFEATYQSWNEPKGATPEAVKHRKSELGKLCALRHKLAKKVRKQGHVISQNLDLKLIDAVYGALGETVKNPARKGGVLYCELAFGCTPVGNEQIKRKERGYANYPPRPILIVVAR